MAENRFDQARLINIANGLTAARILLLPLFAWLLIAGHPREAIVVFIVCGVSDGLDGLLARWLHQRTLIGAYLDPIADKLLMATAFLVLAIVHTIPTWLTVLVISRDIFILIGCFLYLMLLHDAEAEIYPTFFSKLNTFVQILTIVYFLALTGYPSAFDRFAGDITPRLTLAVEIVCAITTTFSGAQYIAIGMKKLAKG
ncbi:MAG TPA: CDP-alcohol phosphatidyltransferase family protein [Candidatus Deferrimicrobiaceae bacterium]